MTPYELISQHYGDRTTKRSGVRLMNHIDEGLTILDRLPSVDLGAREGYCLHPLLQMDGDLASNFEYVARHTIDTRAAMLAIEYRSVANQFLLTNMLNDYHWLWGSRPLSCLSHRDGNKIRLSPIKAVNDMLIADKVQNRKDFLRYHYGSHQHAAALDLYFGMWLYRLGITEKHYRELVEGL